jgi:hypothetical protein
MLQLISDEIAEYPGRGAGKKYCSLLQRLATFDVLSVRTWSSSFQGQMYR